MRYAPANRRSEPPVACDFLAMDGAQRERYRALRLLLCEDLEEVRELDDGYAFRHSSDPSVVMAVAEYVTLERLCCPFLDFRIEAGHSGGPTWLSMTGPVGTKEILAAEIVPGA